MNKCPITYKDCGDRKYSPEGLKILSPGLSTLDDFPLTAQEQRREAAARAAKMSIQGVQPKLSVILKIKKHVFEVVDKGGTYIIKPQSDVYDQLPENEDLTMKLAKICGLNVPVHGMVYCKDGSLSYFIKRFDRYGKHKKYPQEDFAQLTGNTRETKYDWSMEKVIPVIAQYCTFPAIENGKLFHLVLFCFLTGNEDMHLKNFSLITRGIKTELSPVYDLLNTTIAIKNAKEESALPIRGGKRNLTRRDLIQYFGRERLNLNDKIIERILESFKEKKQAIDHLIQNSFLNAEMNQKYLELAEERYKRMELN
ncbi:MAG: HipA domain-containing protein [bacterium]